VLGILRGRSAIFDQRSVALLGLGGTQFRMISYYPVLSWPCARPLATRFPLPSFVQARGASRKSRSPLSLCRLIVGKLVSAARIAVFTRTQAGAARELSRAFPCLAETGSASQWLVGGRCVGAPLRGGS